MRGGGEFMQEFQQTETEEKNFLVGGTEFYVTSKKKPSSAELREKFWQKARYVTHPHPPPPRPLKFFSDQHPRIHANHPVKWGDMSWVNLIVQWSMWFMSEVTTSWGTCNRLYCCKKNYPSLHMNRFGWKSLQTLRKVSLNINCNLSFVSHYK